MPKSAIEVFLKQRSVQILLIFNCILLVASWAMSLSAFPRLPNLRNLLFFVTPMFQTCLFLVFFWGSRRIARKRGEGRKSRILQEAVFLLFLFIQLLLIHVQRTLIYLAHGVAQGYNPVYVAALFLIFLLLIPYFRLRLRMRE
jgi:magnesium-transporting ATPase (P-type)